MHYLIYNYIFLDYKKICIIEITEKVRMNEAISFLYIALFSNLINQFIGNISILISFLFKSVIKSNIYESTYITLSIDRIITESKVYASKYTNDIKNNYPVAWFLVYIDKNYYLGYRETKIIDKFTNAAPTIIYHFYSASSQKLAILDKLIKSTPKESLTHICSRFSRYSYHKTTLPSLHINDKLINYMRSYYEESLKICGNGGILLCGKPGCGKSTNIKAYAAKYGMNILFIKQSRMDDPTNAILESDTENAIILFEDFTENFYETWGLNGEKPAEGEYSFLLNIMSGIPKINNCLWIFTTNNNEIDKDEKIRALFRAGRLGLKIELFHDKTFNTTHF